MHHDRHEARRSKQAKHCQNDNGQQVPAVNFQQLCQNAFGRFNSGVDAGFIRTGVIDVRVHQYVCMRVLKAVRIPISASMRVSTKHPAHDQYASDEQNQIGAEAGIQRAEW